jgi:hypothetical protein
MLQKSQHHLFLRSDPSDEGYDVAKLNPIGGIIRQALANVSQKA